MRFWGVNFRSLAALNKAATTALNKDKAVRVHKGFLLSIFPSDNSV